MKQLIIFATGNKGKIREIRDIITDPDTEVLSMREAGVEADPDENGTSFEENADPEKESGRHSVSGHREHADHGHV